MFLFDLRAPPAQRECAHSWTRGAREQKHGTGNARGFFGARVCVVPQPWRVKVEKAGCARAPACHLAELACAAMDGAGAEKGGGGGEGGPPAGTKAALCVRVRCAELRMQAANES